MNHKKVKPLADRVYVRPTQKDMKKTESGIILPDAGLDGKKVWGTVVSVSDGYYSQNGVKIPLSVNVGDEVMYNHGHGEELQLNGENLLIFKEHELISVISE